MQLNNGDKYSVGAVSSCFGVIVCKENYIYRHWTWECVRGEDDVTAAITITNIITVDFLFNRSYFALV